ncbi:MAG: glutathione S-transferase family protein [Gammaproteobacteria bacterium]|nr:glutathione S-transferase family protein [Gammaproteobacteria bacterium]
MPTLYEFPPTRSNRVKWALEELGIDYTSSFVDFFKSEQQSEQHKRIHPLGLVPVYQTDTYTMYESVAILLQVLDEYPHAKLAPPIGTAERGIYYQWCVFSSAELDPHLFDFMKHTMHLSEEERVPQIAQRAEKQFRARGQVLSDFLQDKHYVLGQHFSGADIALGYSCNWAAYTGLLKEYPILVEYYARLQCRPSFHKVFGS